MASHQHIPPFPDNIDRDHFGSWLSGFTDGEGCFRLYIDKRYGGIPNAEFAIALRADDHRALILIQSFWNTGFLRVRSMQQRTNNHRNACYNIYNKSDLYNVIIPHFERYPLLAKKRRDFEIWKEGVVLLYRMSLVPIRHCVGRRGMIPKWSQDDRDRFGLLVAELQTVRAYDDSSFGGIRFSRKRGDHVQRELWA